MRFFIKNIILYPKDLNKEIRSIEFHTEKVNVIRGYSHRGKSAITHIIDYCLGSSDCNIPINLIRDKVRMYAIIVKTDTMDFFLARNNPETNDSTTTMFMFEDIDLKVSQFKNRNIFERLDNIKTNRVGVITRFNQLLGFSNNVIEEGDSNSFWNGAASFRDLSAFQFQPQPIIANPTTLFYKTETYKHQNKLRSILPLLLGYKTQEMIFLESQIADLQKSKEEYEMRLEKEQNSFELWKLDLYSIYAEAINLGLTNRSLDKNEVVVTDIIDELEKIVNKANSGYLFQEGSSSQYVEKFEELNARRGVLISNLDDLKLSLLKIQTIDDSREKYLQEVIKPKSDRLTPVEWFIKEYSNESCPFCNSSSNKAKQTIMLLNDELIKIKETQKVLTSAEINLDKQISLLKKQISQTEKELEEIDIILMTLKNENKDRATIESIYQFIGRIEQAIVNVRNTLPDGNLKKSINDLEQEISTKRNSLEKLQGTLTEEIAKANISKQILKYTSILDIEDGTTSRTILDTDSLTIKIKDPKKDKAFYLSQIGSGANHMGYHIATLFGLHEYFLTLGRLNRKNYIPGFLVLDQPSQVYFPQTFRNKEVINDHDSDDEDFRNTKKIFYACSEFVKNTLGAVQLIVLEHVPPLAWQGINNIHLVQDWTGDKEENALIPRSWL